MMLWERWGGICCCTYKNKTVAIWPSSGWIPKVDHFHLVWNNIIHISSSHRSTFFLDLLPENFTKKMRNIFPNLLTYPWYEVEHQSLNLNKPINNTSSHTQTTGCLGDIASSTLHINLCNSPGKLRSQQYDRHPKHSTWAKIRRPVGRNVGKVRDAEDGIFIHLHWLILWSKSQGCFARIGTKDKTK